MIEPIRGFAFPFRIDPATGGVARQSGDDKLRENIMQIVLTNMGERIMRRDYGAGISRLVHDPNDEALMSIAQYQLGKAIAEHEPRVRVQAITARAEGATLFVQVDYIVALTRVPGEVRVPIGFT